MSCKLCSIECPWSGAGQGVDLGCLPSPFEMIEHLKKTGEGMSCHSNEKIVCLGLKDHAETNGLKIDKVLPHSVWYRGEKK